MMAIYYFAVLFVFDALVFAGGLRFLWKSKDFRFLPLLLWICVRSISEFITYVYRTEADFSYSTISHVSVFIEALLIIHFYRKFKTKKQKSYFLYFVPLLLFVLETQFLSSIEKPNQLGNLGYTVISILLFLDLILMKDKSTPLLSKLSNVLFSYHCITFPYLIFIGYIRTNTDLMETVYPAFFALIVLLNSILFYLFWTSAAGFTIQPFSRLWKNEQMGKRTITKHEQTT
jgi:hypothetical protein